MGWELLGPGDAAIGCILGAPEPATASWVWSWEDGVVCVHGAARGGAELLRTNIITTPPAGSLPDVSLSFSSLQPRLQTSASITFLSKIPDIP